MPKRDEKAIEQREVDTTDPCYCPACGKLTFSAFPVHLREKDGTDTLICHIIKCFDCGRIKNYGGNWGIGKLRGKVMYADYENWLELKRNNITPEQFLDAIFARPEGHIWLDARNGLKPVEPEGNQAELIRRWEALTRRKSGGFVRV